jgi:hypothetical protein
MKHQKGLDAANWLPAVLTQIVWVVVLCPAVVDAQQISGFFQSKDHLEADSNKTLSLLNNTTPICQDLIIEDTYLCADYRNPTDYLEELTMDRVLVNDPMQKTLSIDSSFFQLNDCNVGRVSYFFRIYNPTADLYSNTCEFKVMVEADHRYTINFPPDAETQCVEPAMPTISTQSLGCDLVTVGQLPIERFNATADECYTELITYRVLNWCEYDGSGLPNLIPSKPEGVAVTVHVNPGVQDGDIALSLRVNNQINPFLTVTKANYTTNYEGGFFQYQQKITVRDNLPPILEITTEDLTFDSYGGLPNGNCTATVVITSVLRDSCTLMTEDLSVPKAFLDLYRDGIGSITSNDHQYDYDLSSGFFQIQQFEELLEITAPAIPLGEHTFTLRLSDGCGNTTTQEILFSVVDKKAPAPICINGLVVVLSPVDDNGDGYPEMARARLEAPDLLASDELIDCNGPIRLSLGRLEDTPDPTRWFIDYTCADPLLETLPVRVYAWDAADNYDFCETYIIVEDNAEACDQMATIGIGGMVLTEDNEPVESVALSINHPTAPHYMTDASGTYQFEDLTPGSDYTVQLSKEDHPSNGVTTFDLVLISKHILRVRPLGSPYKIIAADANNSGTVTTLDLIHLRRLILRLESELEGNTSWRFVPVDYSFQEPHNPFAENWPEVKNYNNLEVADLEADFIAIKVGDVNGSVRSNSNQPGYRSNYSSQLILETSAIQFETGKTFEVPITASNLQAMDGMQFTLTYNPTVLQLEEIASSLPGAVFGSWKEEGIITYSWINESGNSLDSIPALLELKFTAKNAGQLSEVMDLNNRQIEAEAYDTFGSHLGLRLQYLDQSPLTTPLSNWSIWPNPAQEFAQLEYTLPQKETVTFTVTDFQGRLVQQWQAAMDSGPQRTRLAISEWKQGPGVYWITLSTDEWQQQGKLIKIN